MTRKYDILICGAGITGIAAAYYLTRAGMKNILLIDERPPLSLTSDRSTECYRNWWPDPAMLGLMNRSIDLMESLADESGNIFRLNRRGYLYVTGDENKIPEFIERSTRISNLGGGPLRIHSEVGSYDQPSPQESPQLRLVGADLLLGSELISKYYPYVNKHAVAALHIRRAGWLSAQQLGMYMLEQARLHGVQFESGRVDGIQVSGGQIRSVQLNTGEQIHSPTFVNAAGPFLRLVTKLLGEDLPVYTELHLKTAFQDLHSVVDRKAPLLIWNDPQYLPWDAEERQVLQADPETRWLTGLFPAGVHTRPEGGPDSRTILLLWEYKSVKMDPVLPLPLDQKYLEIVLRGLAAILPRMREYFDHLPRARVDGGYYTRTQENRPLVGRLNTEGAYVIGAVSGFGIMSACAAGELLASHVNGAPLPAYARTFQPDRYQNPDYLKEINLFSDTGQL